MKHISVLSHEVKKYLTIRSGGIYADGTLGAGGHATMIVEQLDPTSTFVGTDLDERSIHHARELLAPYPCTIELHHDSFEALARYGYSYDGILLDLGWNSDQFAEGERGFSFQHDGPLDMRFDQRQTLTADDIINTWDREEIIDLLRRYADERWASRIAQSIVERRPIHSTHALAEIIANSVPQRFHRRGFHPATKTFQALRIAVNDELGVVERAVPDLLEVLRPGGRLLVITFHSGEDRIVKHLFRAYVDTGVYRLIEKKGIVPTDTECSINPRARSARLRVIEKVL